MAKAKKVTRTKITKRGKLPKAALPEATPLSHARAAKLMEPHLPQLQRAVDEESKAGLGVAAGAKSAERFRKTVGEMLVGPKKRGRKQKD